jgi:hypothetical protein
LITFLLSFILSFIPFFLCTKSNQIHLIKQEYEL